MALSKRLLALANLVEDNSNIIDVGCDHALLDIYLTKNRNVNCIASDISLECIKGANNNILKEGLEGKIKTYCCDGIPDVDLSNIDAVIIAGMGTNNILKILDKKDVKRCIIQTNKNIYELRKYMMLNNYIIENELIIYDKGKYYNIIDFRKGNKKYNEFELHFGPFLLKDDNKEYKKYLVKKYTKIKNDKKSIFEKIKLQIFINKIKKYC